MALMDRPRQRLAYSLAETAEELDVSLRHLHRLIADGQIRTVTLGRRRVVPHEELADLLAGRQQASPEGSQHGA